MLESDCLVLAEAGVLPIGADAVAPDAAPTALDAAFVDDSEAADGDAQATGDGGVDSDADAGPIWVIPPDPLPR
jgi:hypothetical protein